MECTVGFSFLCPHLFSKLITFMLLGSFKKLCLFPSHKFIFFLSFEIMQWFHYMICFRIITVYRFILRINCLCHWLHQQANITSSSQDHGHSCCGLPLGRWVSLPPPLVSNLQIGAWGLCAFCSVLTKHSGVLWEQKAVISKPFGNRRWGQQNLHVFNPVWIEDKEQKNTLYVVYHQFLLSDIRMIGTP